MGFLSERLMVDEIPVEVRRNSRRKTRIGLGFDPAGRVIVDAPMDASIDELKAVVLEHGRWLRRRLDAVQADALCVAAPNYQSGELMMYLGDTFELVVSKGASSVRLSELPQLTLFPGLRGIRGRLEVALPEPVPTKVATRVRRWYSQQAKEICAQRLERWSKLPWLKGRLPPLRTSYMRSQWGSCGVDGRIALNTHLVKTPEPVIDYVILHELCHLVHHNHSRRFYSLLASHMPDWEQRRIELDAYVPVLLHQ